MNFALRKVTRSTFRRLGYTINRINTGIPEYVDMEDEFLHLFERCRTFTLTATRPERMYALYKVTRYLVEHDIPGDLVECGVWKGGSMMLVALALQELGVTDRTLWMYDTYAGMSDPSDKDILDDGTPIKATMDRGDWEKTMAPLDEVKANMVTTGYPLNRIHFVQGRVEDTVPARAPGKIALLRLDTDFYESTYHELIHLFPLLESRGALIIDDYGQYKGAREATEEYFTKHNVSIYLHRIDYSARLGIKV